tara:strand:- start:1492 stop:3750 length:2259 start_codon:yes stop_codon:yes gene_type:complete
MSNVKTMGCIALCLVALVPLAGQEEERYFKDKVIPTLDKYCFDCHDPEDSKGDVLFLDAEKPSDLANAFKAWNSVSFQLQHRTMPPAKRKLQPTAEERRELAEWITKYLRGAMAEAPPFAPEITARRLNRLEFDNTVRELMGVSLGFSETFPLEGGGGEGFDNNGETLYLPAMLMERFVEASQQIVDASIVSPMLRKSYEPKDFSPKLKNANEAYLLPQGKEASLLFPVYVQSTYEIIVRAVPDGKAPFHLAAKIDGVRIKELVFQKGGKVSFELQLTRGTHLVALQSSGEGAGRLLSLKVKEQARPDYPEQARSHARLLGLKPGQIPQNPRRWTASFLESFLAKAYRRPTREGEADRFLALYDRAAGRGDPFEERLKLVIKGILVSPDFMFRLETPAKAEKLEPVTDYELASRLSYFLWSGMPDDELFALAREGRLNNDETLSQQVDRMLKDPRAKVFSKTFIGQWLGTKDIGGRVAPTDNAIQNVYSPLVAAAMRRECVLFYDHLLQDNRSVLELLDSNYTFANRHLAKFYGWKNLDRFAGDKFRKVAFENNRRGGLLGMGAVLAFTSHRRKTSPVLRGAWVFDTLFGTPVPPPPADVPPLRQKNKEGKELSVLQMLELHRADPTCATCHNLIDPIGFGLENFDFLGRWREKDKGKPLHLKGTLPTGESFEGPAELRKVLLQSGDVFLRNLVRKTLGYALGRGLSDGDESTVERVARQLEASGHGARDLVRAIVLSAPFRNKQRAPASSP